MAVQALLGQPGTANSSLSDEEREQTVDVSMPSLIHTMSTNVLWLDASESTRMCRFLADWRTT